MTNDVIFSNSFVFNTFEFSKQKYTDNRDGCPVHYFAYMLSGKARLCEKDKTVEISEGDVFYIPNGCKYQSFWQGSPEIRFISLGFTFLPNFQRRRFGIQVIPCDKKARALFLAIAKDKAPSGETVGKFYTLVGMLLPNMRYEEEERGSTVVRLAKEYLLEHPRVTVSELAKVCTVSQSALYASFKKYSDVSINKYRNQILMEMAQKWLVSTDVPIESISERLGISSPSYFRKQFHAYFHMSPREMRQTQKI